MSGCSFVSSGWNTKPRSANSTPATMIAGPAGGADPSQLDVPLAAGDLAERGLDARDGAAHGGEPTGSSPSSRVPLVGWTGRSPPRTPLRKSPHDQPSAVTKVYRNGVTALEDVSVEVEKGEFVFVVGQSGSGKSTLIRLLLKEEEATKGERLRRRQEPREDHVLEGAVPAPEHRDGLPGLQAVDRQDRVRERGVRAGGHRQAEARDRPAGARDPGVRGPGRQAQQLSRTSSRAASSNGSRSREPA